MPFPSLPPKVAERAARMDCHALEPGNVLRRRRGDPCLLCCERQPARLSPLLLGHDRDSCQAGLGGLSAGCSTAGR
ncbi:hypothetical protein CDD83_4594 [Cordyceps sp. RAO-2017]|nr:hypothetical protein CDD83_4594 [Cordyceps sp. RAO-2017]